MQSILTNHIALETKFSPVAKEDRPFLVPRTPEGEQAIQAFQDLQSKIEVLPIKVSILYSPRLENLAIPLPCIRLRFDPNFGPYEIWLEKATELAKKILRDKKCSP